MRERNPALWKVLESSVCGDIPGTLLGSIPGMAAGSLKSPLVLSQSKDGGQRLPLSANQKALGMATKALDKGCCL